MKLLATATMVKPIRANGPCGCTLTVGDAVIVDGLQGRGVVVARKGRRLVIRFRDGEYLSRDQRYVHKITSDYVSRYASNKETNMVLNAGEVNVEMERGPLDKPKNGYIVKQGALFCVKSRNQQDKNFGCFNSREEAEMHLSWISMNLRATATLRAYGTSEGVKKEWDTRGRGRKENYQIDPPKSSFETGKPVELVGYHNSGGKDDLKMGQRGIFFAEAPANDYGEWTHRALIRMKNPFVAEEQVDAATKLWPGVNQGKAGPADIRSMLSDKVDPMLGTPEWWGTMDRGITAELKKRGYDGIIYTDPEALSKREFAVFDTKNFDIGWVGKSADWIKEFPKEAKATDWAKYVKKSNDANSMDLDAAKVFKQQFLNDMFKQRAKALLEKHMKNLAAAGTSEGAKKAWDTRGRGKKKAPVKPTTKQAEQAKTLYTALGTVIVKAHQKMDMGEHMKDADTVGKKMFHLIKTVGSWLEAGSALAGMHEMIHRGLQHMNNAGPQLWNTLAWAHQHLLPVMQHVTSLAGITSAADVSAEGFSSSRGRGSYRPKHVGLKGPNFHRPNPSGHAGFNVRKPNMSLHHNHRLEGESVPKLKADMDGEPMTGNMGHVHMEPNVWFHPPSLTKRNSKESLRIPTDDPGEKNDKFGDVTQRDDPKTNEFRMKLLKRSAPGGLPAQIPARTTLLSPHSGTYMPTGTGMYGAVRAARSRRIGFTNNRGTFVSFKNRGRI